jgi:hypothetical protein
MRSSVLSRLGCVSAVAGAVALAALATAAAAPGPAGGSFRQTELDVTLGVFFDAAGTVCSGTIQPGPPSTIYIVARTAPGTELIAGAEFRFTGLPSSWTAYAFPNPQCTNIGDPFGNGVIVAATQTQCQPQWSTFLMYTVLVFASTEVENVQFELTNREPPSNRAFRCPLVVRCGYDLACVETSPCFVNQTGSVPCEKPTAVTNSTWTQVREMYR